MDVLLTALGAVVCLACGLLAGWFAHGARAARQDVALAARASAADATATLLRAQLDQQQTQHAARVEELLERIDHLKDIEAARAQEDGRVLTALSPVAEQLRSVQSKVAELEQQRQRQHGELSAQLRQAGEADERLRTTTEALAAALRSNSTRGVWGETQLRSVVEAAGLLHRVDFDLQASITTDGGGARPDMIVHLPGGKSIAVDAKVPFAAFLEASAIPATATDAEAARREQLIAQHVKALRDHISALGGKAYWSGLSASPELVIAFIPSEGLVSAALEADPSIMEYAFSRRVALASPVTLWSVLKTVAFSWQQQALTEDAKRLFDVSRELYSRLSTTAGHLDKLGRSLKSSVADYNRYVGSMERQVLPSARRLVSIDEASVLNGFAEVEDVPRPLTALELVDGLEEVRRRIDEPPADEVSGRRERSSAER
ncbi:MAG: DNA recombination protein RmuC [Chloroflexota bacterium]|nr:DNA recombination protein RmuC [Chloroflexota bacterium]